MIQQHLTHAPQRDSLQWDIDGASRVILVSNRGPVEHARAADGSLVAHRGAGGVVSGLLGAVGERPVTWIALAMTEADRASAAEGIEPTPPAGLENLTLRFVRVSKRAYARYYDGISNRILWFAQHYLLQPTDSRLFAQRTMTEWEQGYRAVNAAVAEQIAAELTVHGCDTPVFIQDYHLYLVAGMVREQCPNARLAHFVHIPWPEGRYWEMLPSEMSQSIYAGLAANDVLGFQTPRDAQNFLEAAVRFLPEARIQRDGAGQPEALLWQGRRIIARAYPIAVTPEEVLAGARSREAVAAAVRLSDRLHLDDTHRLILRVDRIEPTKNIARGFLAYEQLLAEHEDLHGRVTFLALLVPSRQGMREYQAYEREVRQVIERVNKRFGRAGWQPIVPIFGNSRPRALACMRRYDVLLVNPLIDGMNLVAKEGVLANTRSGVVVLSRTAGAYEQMHEGALGIAPLDTGATAQALYQALTMRPTERRARAYTLRTLLEAESAETWLHRQVADLQQVTREAAAARRSGSGRRNTRTRSTGRWPQPVVEAPAAARTRDAEAPVVARL